LVDGFFAIENLSEKGIRCETGAVPAAVSLCYAFATSATVLFGDGKAAKSEVSQKTCQFKRIICRIFGKKDR